MTLSQQAIRRFMAARYPGARYRKAADSWTLPDSRGLTMEDARQAASAELALAAQGVAKMPAWAEG